MKLPRGLLAVLLLPLLLSGCNLPSFGDNSTTLAPITYHYVFTMQIYECKLVISPDGEVQVAQQTSNDPKDLVRATGHLTADQRTSLHAAFDGWKQLKPQYGDIDFTGPVCTISYDGYEVTSGLGRLTPDSVKKVQTQLDAIVKSTLTAATQPATAPAATKP